MSELIERLRMGGPNALEVCEADAHRQFPSLPHREVA